MAIIDNTPQTVLAVWLVGKLVKEDVVEIEQALKAKLETNRHVGIVVDTMAFEDLTPGAVVENMRLELSMLDKLDRIPKIAVVTDKQWL